MQDSTAGSHSWQHPAQLWAHGHAGRLAARAGLMRRRRQWRRQHPEKQTHCTPLHTVHTNTLKPETTYWGPCRKRWRRDRLGTAAWSTCSLFQGALSDLNGLTAEVAHQRVAVYAAFVGGQPQEGFELLLRFLLLPRHGYGLQCGVRCSVPSHPVVCWACCSGAPSTNRCGVP